MKSSIDVIYVQNDTKIKNGMLDKEWAFLALGYNGSYQGFACNKEHTALALSKYFKQMANALKKKAAKGKK